MIIWKGGRAAMGVWGASACWGHHGLATRGGQNHDDNVYEELMIHMMRMMMLVVVVVVVKCRCVLKVVMVMIVKMKFRCVLKATLGCWQGGIWAVRAGCLTSPSRLLKSYWKYFLVQTSFHILTARYTLFWRPGTQYGEEGGPRDWVLWARSRSILVEFGETRHQLIETWRVNICHHHIHHQCQGDEVGRAMLE